MIHATPARSLRPVTRITLAVVVAASSAFVAGGLLAASRADATPILPTVSSISPSTGTSAGGTTVRINGLNLSTTTAVQFGSSSVSFTYVPPPAQRPFGVVSPRGLPPAGYLTVTSPSGTPGAAVHLTVTNGVGTSTTSSNDLFTFDATAPAAPTITSASATNGGITVAYTDGSSNGSSIISHALRAYAGASLIATKSDCTSSPCTISGLTNGTSYTVTATATNGVGESPASSASSAVTPVTVPGAPTQVTAVRADASAVVSWNPPAGNGGGMITSYRVTATDVSDAGAGGQSCTYTVVTPETDTCTVTGLTNGDSYTFTAVATNDAGSSPDSSASSAVIPAGLPAAPTAVSATPGDAEATVSWIPGSANGASLTSATVSVFSGATLVATVSTCSSSPCLVTGLTDGTSYTFTVSTTNGVGQGPASSASSPVTPVGAGWVMIAGIWFAPGSDHRGTDFSGKDLSAKVFPASVDLSGSDFSNANLDGTDLSATTLDGASGCGITGTPILSYSWVIVSGCLVAMPGAPASAIGTSDHLQSLVSWTPPTDDGGLPVTSYVVTVTGDPSLTCTYTVPTAPTPEVDECLITGLVDGTSYTFDVVAHTAAGAGPAATTSTVIPAVHLAGYAIYPGADLSGANLAGADLSGLNLSGTNFTGANLSGADLTGTTLYLTNFTMADLSGADLSGLDLQHVTLTDDGAGGANLSGADLTGDNLTSLDLTSVNFTGAKLGNAIFGHIDDDESDEASESLVNFTDAYLVGATFGFDHTPADITGWTFAGADLTGVSLANADLSMSNMTGANLTNTNLSGAVLVGTTLTDATVAGTTLGTATLTSLVSSGLIGTPASLPSGWYVVSGSIRQVMEPQSPPVVTGTPGYGSIDVSWTTPGDNGGAPITSYRASVIGDDSLACTYTVPVGVEQDACTITGLAAGTTYGIQVVATNSVGLSSSPTWSDPVTTLVPVPVFTTASSTVFVRGHLGSFTIAADHADSLSISGTLPRQLRFHDNGDGTATISGRPDRDQGAASTTVTITATGQASSTQDLQIIVAKRARILVHRGRWVGWSQHRLQFKVGSSLGVRIEVDAGGYLAPLHVTGLPGWATFHDHGDGTGSITGSPAEGDVGTSVVTFSVDGLSIATTRKLIVSAAGSATTTTSSTTTTAP